MLRPIRFQCVGTILGGISGRRLSRQLSEDGAISGVDCTHIYVCRYVWMCMYVVCVCVCLCVHTVDADSREASRTPND
jgi:hypothetical protein